MKDVKQKYNKKIKQRNIKFYLHEMDLYDYSKTINFNKLIKETLRKEMSKK